MEFECRYIGGRVGFHNLQVTNQENKLRKNTSQKAAGHAHTLAIMSPRGMPKKVAVEKPAEATDIVPARCCKGVVSAM